MIRFSAIVRGATSLALLSVLSGCQSVPTLGLPIHRIDIQQGNVVTQEMVEKLRPGMSRQQVRFVLGTPPLTDPFHPDRWDYVYYYSKAGKVIEHRRLILFFEADALKRIEGDVTPGSGRAPAPKTAVPAPPAAAKPPAAAPVAETPSVSPADVPNKP